MILNNRWRFFDKRGNSMSLLPLYGVEVLAIDPTESGSGARFVAYTDRSGEIIHVEITSGGVGYSSATYLSFSSANTNTGSETIWVTDPSDLTVGGGVITSFVIPPSVQNTGFPYPNVTWVGENYFDKVSIDLIESEQLFVLEEVIDSSTGETTYTYPRLDEYGPYSFTTYEGDGTYIKFTDFGHSLTKGMEIRLFGGSPYDEIYIVDHVTRDTFYVSNSVSFASTPGTGLSYSVIPKLKASLFSGDEEIFVYTVDYGVNTPVIRKGTELLFEPDNGTYPIADTTPLLNLPYIRTVDSTELRPDALQINIGLQGGYEAVFTSNLIISDISFPEDPQLICQISYRGETVGEDERFAKILENFGLQIGLGEETIFRESDVNEDLPDYELLNNKRKELILEHSNIFPYLGSYKGLVNVINWFGYPDLRIKEYWLNIDKNDQYFGRYKQTQIPLQLKNKGASLGVKESAALLPNSVYKKTSLFGLYYDITKETGEFDLFGVPTTEDAFLFTNEEILIKLFALKKYLKQKFLPLNAQIVDIVGEGIYFERYNVNAWKDDTNIFTITPTNTADFIADKQDLYIRDLRIVEETEILPQPNDATKISDYFTKYEVLSIGVDFEGGGFTEIPALEIVGDSYQRTVARCKVKAESSIGLVSSSGGIGYVIGDIITLGNGVSDSPIRITVATIGGLGNVITFDILSGPNQGANYSVLPVTFSQGFVTTITGTSYAPGTGSGFEVDSNLLTYSIDSVRLSQRGKGYINQPTYSFTPAAPVSPVLKINTKEIPNDNLIAYFNNYDGVINLNDEPNIPVGATIDLTCTSFNVTWEDASPFTWKSLEGSEEAGITPIVSYLPSGSGQVTGFIIVNGGTGYKTAPTVSITGGGGFGATATCTILNGVVNTITLVSGGSGYISDPDVKVDGGITNTLYSWENIGKGDYYEMEWKVLLVESPQNKQWSSSLRGTVGNLEKYQITVPYIGKYDIELYLYDTDNNFTNEYKNKFITVKLPQVEFSYVTRYNDCRDTWEEFGVPQPTILPTSVSPANFVPPSIPVVLNESTLGDQPVSWDEMFSRWVNPIYIDTNWEDATVRWDTLETSDVDTLNRFNFPPCKDFDIERLSPYDVIEGKIISVDNTTNTIIVTGQITRPELRTGDRIFIKRDLTIYEFLVNLTDYTTPGQTSITLVSPLPNGLNDTWQVLREIESIIEVSGNAIYDSVNNVFGFKTGNYIKIKGADDIPKVPRIPVSNVNTNPLNGLYQSISFGSPYDTDIRFNEINEIGQLYKLRDFHPTNGNLVWDPNINNSVWDLRPVMEGSYPGTPSDYKGKLYINKSPGNLYPITTANPVDEIRPGFTVIIVYIKDLLGNVIYEQRLRTIHIFENRSTSGPTWDIWKEPGVVGPPFDPSNIIEIDVEAIDRGRLSQFNVIASTPGYVTTCEYEYENFPTRVQAVTTAPGFVTLEMNFNTNPASSIFDISTFPPTLIELSENANWFYNHGVVSGDFSMQIINMGLSQVTGNTLITVNDTDYELGRSSGSFIACSRDFDEDYAEQRLGTLILQWKNFNENRWSQMCSQSWDTLSYHENIFCGWELDSVAPNGRIQFNDEPTFEFQTITGALSQPYTWRFALEELNNSDNSGIVRFYYKMDWRNTMFTNSSQTIGDTYIIVEDITGVSVGDTIIGEYIPYNASISAITPVSGGYQLDLVAEDGLTPIAVTLSLTQRIEIILGSSLSQRILVTAKNPGADSLGFLEGTNGVFFYDSLDLGPVTISHSFPLGNMSRWLNDASVGGNQGGRDRLILRYANLQTYFYEGQNPSGEAGWYPSLNLNTFYDSVDNRWQSFRLPYERSITSSWSYEETKIGNRETRVPTGSSVLFVPDNCTIAGKTRFLWTISEQLSETERINLVETIDPEIMWLFSHSGDYNISLEIIDTNGNVGYREKKHFINVYDEE